MRFLVIAFLLASTQAWAGAQLPLKNGVYIKDSCAQFEKYLKTQDFKDTPNSEDTMWVFAEKGYPLMLAPTADAGPSGYCAVKSMKRSGDTYSGVSSCREGRAENFSGTYKFSYTVQGPEKFTSDGKDYVWCADYRWGRN